MQRELMVNYVGTLSDLYTHDVQYAFTVFSFGGGIIESCGIIGIYLNAYPNHILSHVTGARAIEPNKYNHLPCS